MSLADWQAQLSQALLSPDSPETGTLSELSGIEGRRLALYEELMLNTVAETLRGIYPHTCQLLSGKGAQEAEWRALADRFRRSRPNTSHKLVGAVCGFPEYLNAQTDLMERFPFLAELALYEWLEMEVLNLPDARVDAGLTPEIPSVEDFSRFAPFWNPARKLRSFVYNIPALLDALQAADYRIEAASIAPESVEILIYRDPETLRARFFCLNDLTARLLRLSDGGSSYEQALLALHAEIPGLETLSAEIVCAQARRLFQNCLESGVVLGSLPV